MKNFRTLCVLAPLVIAQSGITQEPTTSFTNHTTPVSNLTFSPDGRTIVSVCSKEVRTWNPASGKEVRVRKGIGGQVVGFGPKVEKLAIAMQFARTGSDIVTLTELATGKELLVFEPLRDRGVKTPFRPTIGAIAMSPDGKQIATAGSKAKLSPTHGLLLGVVSLWDAESGKLIRQFDLSTFASTLAFSADGKRLAAGTDGVGGELPESGEVWIWEVATGKAVHTFKTRAEIAAGGNPFPALAVAFHPDGKQFVVAVGGRRAARPAGLVVPEGAEPAEVLIWDLPNARVTHTLHGHDRWVGNLVYSPDGKWLASGGGGDEYVRIRSAATGKEQMAFRFGTEVNTLAFSPDSRQLAAGGSIDGKTGIVHVFTIGGGKD